MTGEHMTQPTNVRSRSTIALAVATAVLLLGGLIAFAVTRDDGSDEQNLAGEAASTTTSAAGGTSSEGSTTSTLANGGTPAATGDGSSAGTTATSAGASPAPTVAGPATPAERGTAPRPGTYRYRTTQSGEEPEESDRIVRDVQRTHTEVHQQIESADTSTGGRVRNDVIWRGEGLVVTKSTFSGPQGDIECDWQPDMLEFPAPLAVGKKWTIESSCNTTAQGQPVRVERKANREVTGAEKLSVGGEAVDTWVVTGDDRLTITVGPPEAPVFKQVVDTNGTVHVSPAHGVEIRGVTNIKTGDTSRTITQELLSLQPR